MPDFNWINAQVKGATDAARFLWRQSGNRTHWQINVADEWIPVVYDRKRGTVVTCLPRSERYSGNGAPQ